MNREERTEAYVMDNMTAPERLLFEQEMAKDPVLMEEVDEMRTLLLGIETSNLKQKLQALSAQERSANVVAIDKKEEPTRNFGWWAKAASILLLVGLGAWFLFRSNQPQTDLFAQFYYADPGLQTPMSAIDQYAFYDAMVDYKAEKYQTAIEKWSTQLVDAPTNDTLLYYIASAQLNIGDEATALSHFQQVINQPNSHFNQKAKWYWSLIQARNEEWNLIKSRWSEWNMVDQGLSIYPLQQFWDSVSDKASR